MTGPRWVGTGAPGFRNAGELWRDGSGPCPLFVLLLIMRYLLIAENKAAEGPPKELAFSIVLFVLFFVFLSVFVVNTPIVRTPFLGNIYIRVHAALSKDATLSY
jgi:hypothetical protein